MCIRDRSCDFEDFGLAPLARCYTSTCPKGGKPYERFSVVRNKVLDKAFELDCDLLFSVDSDLVIRPDALERLLYTMRDSTVIALPVNNTARNLRSSTRLINAIYNYGLPSGHRKYAKRTTDPVMPVRGNKVEWGKVLEVPYTGACQLIDLFFIGKHNIRYEPCIKGEDIGFCEKIYKCEGSVRIDLSKNHECLHLQENWLISAARITDYMLGGCPYPELSAGN